MIWMSDELSFRSTVGPHRATTMLNALEQGVKDVLEVEAAHPFREMRTRPTLVFDLVTGTLETEFAEDPGVKHTIEGQQHWWVIEDQFALRVKKLNAKMATRNARTDQQDTIDDQELDLEGVHPVVVTIGPHYSALTGLPIDYLAVRHTRNASGKVVPEWFVSLRDLAAGTLAATTATLPQQPGPDIAAKVVAKRKSSSTIAEER